MTRWEEALVELFRSRGTALARYAYLLTGDEHESEDLVQDAVVRVLTRHGALGDPGALEAYVRRAMLNRVVDQARRRQRWTALVPRLTRPHVTRSPEQSVVEAEATRTALRALSPRQRACVVLRFYEDKPVKQVANLLGMSEGSVKRHLADATARLRRAPALAPEGGDDARLA